MHKLWCNNGRFLKRLRWFVLAVALLLLSSCSYEQTTEEPMVNLEQVKDDENAQLENLSAAIARNKQDASLYARRAKLLLKRKDFDKALQDIDAAIALNEANMSYHFLKAHVLRAMNKPADALALALKAERNSYQNAGVYILLSDLYLQLKQPQQAAETVRKAIALSPKNGYALYYRGKVAAATGDTARAFTNYRSALAEEPDLPEARREMAGALVHLGQYDESRVHLAQTMKKLPNDAIVWFYQGELYQHTQKTDSALWSYRKALALADTLQAAHAKAGLILFTRANYEEAIPHLQQVAERNKHNIKYLSALATAYERTGQLLNALEIYQRLQALQPDNYYYNQSVGRIKAKLTRPAPIVSKADTATINE